MTMRVAGWFLPIFLATTASAQSGTVVNAADNLVFAPTFGSLNGPFLVSSGQTLPAHLAPGSLAVIRLDSQADPTAATVALRSFGSASTISAQVIASDSASVTFVVPPAIPQGDAQVVYRIGTGVTQWTPVTIAGAAFALFRSGATGPLLAQQFNGDGSISPNGLSTPAKPGQVVTLWGSGLGTTPASRVAVSLDGVAQTVLFAGRSPSVPGVDQINFRVSVGSSGCYVPLVVTYGTQTASYFLSVTQDGSACFHPFGLTATDLQKLDAGGSVVVGKINTSSSLWVSSAEHATRQEEASIVFTAVGATGIANLARVDHPDVGCRAPLTPISVLLYSGFLGAPLPGGFGSSIVLASGATSLRLTPPQDPLANYSVAIPATSDAPLANVPAPIIAGGRWTLSSTFATPITYFQMPPLQLNGGAPLTFNRSEDQTVKWDGTGYDPGAQLYLSIEGRSQLLLTCTVPANKGSLVIPAALLAGIDPTAATLTAQVTEPSPPFAARVSLANGTTVVIVPNPVTSDERPVDIQ